MAEGGRYVHLLQPNRDMAANWSVDVARELESYLAELSITPLFQDGNASLNFAEAALLIQGSIQVYSRKVEYLYALVLQALESISQKKYSQQEKTSIQENGTDADVVEDKEEDFLNLDDIPEEKNIDMDEGANDAGFLTPAVKPPAGLLVVEWENADMFEDVGELGSFQIATSSLHKDFLLLDPCDAECLDEYLRSNDGGCERKETPAQPSTTHRRTPKGGLSTPGRNNAQATGGVEAKHSASKNTPLDATQDVGAWESEHDGRNMPDDPNVVRSTEKINCDDGRQHNFFESNTDVEDYPVEVNASFGGDSEDDDDIDPWLPLNPHKPGTLPIKPYVRGVLHRKQKTKKLLEDYVEFPLARKDGPIFPEFVDAWQDLVCKEREMKRGNNCIPPYEKLRRSFFQNTSAFDAMMDLDDEFDDLGMHENLDCEYGIWDGLGQPGYESTSVDALGSQDESQKYKDNANDNACSSEHAKDDDKISFEELCRAYLDDTLKNLAESEVRTELCVRVSNWRQRIEKILAIEERHPAFDIHALGENVLQKLSASDMPSGRIKAMSFTDLVKGKEKHEVGRTFASLLQLVNNGNVLLDTGHARNSPTCFNKDNPFTVKLVSSDRVHERILLFPTSSVAVKMNTISSRPSAVKHKKSQLLNCREIRDSASASLEHEEDRDAMIACTPPLCNLSNHSLVATKGRLSSVTRAGRLLNQDDLVSPSTVGSTKLTPEGKRRRRPLR